MGDTIEGVAGQLRTLAVELVRGGKSGDAAAVLVAIGAIELLPSFADVRRAGELVPHMSPSPGY